MASKNILIKLILDRTNLLRRAGYSDFRISQLYECMKTHIGRRFKLLKELDECQLNSLYYYMKEVTSEVDEKKFSEVGQK